MQKWIVTTLLLLTAIASFAQQRYAPTYDQLKEYQGVYEFQHGTNLSMAVSPKDTMLYAIIHKSKYALRPFAKDIFLNVANEKIRFIRDGARHIIAYADDKDTLKLLDSNVSFPETMWYPRLGQAPRTYSLPVDRGDGLPVGDPLSAGLDTGLLAQMMMKITDGSYPDVHSVIIIKDGKLVFEEYFYDYNKDSLQELRSASKSIVSALTGIAIDQGFIKGTDEKVLSCFPEYALHNMSDTKNRITIGNLLSNSTGLDCDISNEKSEGNEIKMDYSEDWVKFTLDLPMIDTPGGRGMYCSGNPVTLGRIIEKTTHTYLPDFAVKNLFGPLGIRSFHWNFHPDRSNAEDYCQVYMRPLDMAKFGLLYLNKGQWNSRQIVSSGWVTQSFQQHSVVQGVKYGYLWWLKYLDAGGVRYYGKAAQGNGGQKIYIWEQQNMVTVITGGSYNTKSPSDELISKYILRAFNPK